MELLAGSGACLGIMARRPRAVAALVVLCCLWFESGSRGKGERESRGRREGWAGGGRGRLCGTRPRVGATAAERKQV